MKKLLLLLILALTISANSQDVQNVSLTVTASGKTKEEAKYNAFRDALEQAFGAFISTNTQILNDELIRDEIVSISAGNIHDFKIKSEIVLPDGSFSNVMDVTVSVKKLKSFCESKGVKVEVQGGMFVANLKLQELNKSNEIKMIQNMIETASKIALVSFDYSLSVSNQPKKSTHYQGYHMIDVFVEAKPNENFDNIEKIIVATLEEVSLNNQEIESYRSLGTEFYLIAVNNKPYYLRSFESYKIFTEFFERRIHYYSTKFKISSNITEEMSCATLLRNHSYSFMGTRPPKYNNLFIPTSSTNYAFDRNQNNFDLNEDGSLQEASINYWNQFSKASNIEFTKIDFALHKQFLFNKESYPYIHIDFRKSDQIVYNYKVWHHMSLEDLNKLTEYQITPIH